MTDLTGQRPQLTRYCKHCEYNLHGLHENRCPECGNAFNPDDPSTYRTLTRREQFKTWLAGWGIVQVVLVAHLVLIGLIAAFNSAGREYGIFIPIWLYYALFSVVLSSPFVYFGRRRAKWQPYETLVLFLPFTTWAVLMILDDSGKTLANLGEGIEISFAIPVAAIIRVVFGSRKPTWLLPVIIMALLCGVAVAVYLWTPPLPE